jgi:non-specific serine/threonine protein kinase
LAGTGLVETARRDYEAAKSSLEEANALFERCGEGYLPAFSRILLGTTLLARGEADRAERAFEEGLASSRRLKIPSLGYIALYNLAQTVLARGDHEKAARLLREGLLLSGQTKDRANLAHFLKALAAVMAFRGRARRSALLLGAADALLREVGAPVYNFYNPDPSLQDRAAAEARAVLGDAPFEEARELGREMTFEQAIEYALNDGEPSPA